MTCECGGVLDYRQQRAATVITVCGRVTYERAYYSGCGCGKGCAPLDERLHLQPGAVTPGLANLLALSGIQFSHEKSRAWLQARQRQELPAPETLYCTIDASKARTKPRKQPKPPHEDWRDVKTLVWFHTRPVSEKQRTARERRTGRQEAPLRAIDKQYACAITEAEAFGKLLWATGCQANADRAKRLVMLGDGAPWIWNLVRTHFPHAVQIVD